MTHPRQTCLPPLLALLLVGLCALVGEHGRRHSFLRGQNAQQARVWVNLGLAEKDRGNMAEARKCWEVALSYPVGHGRWHYLAQRNLRKLAQVEGRESDMWYHDAEAARLKRDRDERVRKYWEGRE